MRKSVIIGRKLVATFASTSTHLPIYIYQDWELLWNQWVLLRISIMSLLV